MNEISCKTQNVHLVSSFKKKKCLQGGGAFFQWHVRPTLRLGAGETLCTPRVSSPPPPHPMACTPCMPGSISELYRGKGGKAVCLFDRASRFHTTFCLPQELCTQGLLIPQLPNGRFATAFFFLEFSSQTS